MPLSFLVPSLFKLSARLFSVFIQFLALPRRGGSSQRSAAIRPLRRRPDSPTRPAPRLDFLVFAYILNVFRSGGPLAPSYSMQQAGRTTTHFVNVFPHFGPAGFSVTLPVQLDSRPGWLSGGRCWRWWLASSPTMTPMSAPPLKWKLATLKSRAHRWSVVWMASLQPSLSRRAILELCSWNQFKGCGQWYFRAFQCQAGLGNSLGA